MGLTALQPQSEPKTTPRSTEWCESGQQGPWQTVVPFHKLVCSIIGAASSNRNEKHQTSPDIRRHDILNRTRIQKILDRLTKGTPDKSAALILPIGSILAKSLPRFFGPHPQGVKTIVRRESRHSMHTINGRPPFRPDRDLLLWRDP